MKGLIVAVLYTSVAIAYATESKLAEVQQTENTLPPSTNSLSSQLSEHVTPKAIASIVSLRTVDGIHFCGGVLFTERHVIVPTICVITLYGTDYKDVHVWLGVVMNKMSNISRRIGDLDVDRRGVLKIAVITMHKSVELSNCISVVHLATEYPKDIAATVGYDQKTCDYMMNKVSDFDSIMCDDTPITEPESEPEPEPEPRLELQCDPEPLREKAPLRVYEPSNQRIILGVHNLALGDPVFFYGKLVGVFLENEKDNSADGFAEHRFIPVRRSTCYIKDIIHENEQLE